MKQNKPQYRPARIFTVAEDGFFGMYYEPSENRFPGKGMVVCSGTDGSFLFTRLAAEMFFKAGMPVIALGYWNTEGTPDEPMNIPVEYMHNACLWLKVHKNLHPGVWGISLGAEYGLLCGSLYEDIACVVAASPVHAVTQTGSFKGGLHFATGSPFSLAGKPLPYTGADGKEKQYLKQMKRNFLKRLEPDMLFYYEEILKQAHDPAADIAVEKINGPVLLISGASDVMVPAAWVGAQVMKRLDEHNFSHPHIHKNYQPLSHYACMFRPLTSSMFRVERKYRRACDENRRDSWEFTLSFLQDSWQV
ncbi:MAG: hypothetical protein IJ120_00215 [Solobacterium sp.]|nr:hypothetical protein [Solobacterium sp.]